MKAAAMYLLTAVVTGAHASWMASEMIWGAPPNPLHFISFGGSILLLVAALRFRASPRTRAKIGLGGCVAAWCLYAPLSVLCAFMPYTMGEEVRLFLSLREYVPLVGLFGGSILLVATTVYTILLLMGSRRTL